MSTQQDQVSAVANLLISLTAGLAATKIQIDQASAAWTNLSVATKVNAYPTAPLLTTGALGTADVSPTITNPIDTRIAPGNTLTTAISANNIAGLLTYLQGISTAIGGGAVSANGASVQLVALTH